MFVTLRTRSVRFIKDKNEERIMFKVLSRIILSFVLLLGLFSSIFAYDVEVFSRYDTDLIVHKNETLEVHKTLYLRNIHDSGIVPGQIEFKFTSDLDGNDAKITSYSATNRYGADIKSQLSQTQDGTVILLDIFTPILPGFEYIINLDYTLEYDGAGIFFKTLEVPLKENARIPVWQGDVSITIPEGHHFTNLNSKYNFTKNGTTVFLSMEEDLPFTMSFEYSRLPISIPNVPGSVIFWLVINLIIFTLLGIEIRKELKRRN